MSLINNYLTNFASNNFLNNFSNKLNRISFESLSGQLELTLIAGDNIKYGYILVDIKNAVDFCLFYDGMQIMKYTGSGQKMLPCVFEDNAILKTSGMCGNLEISIYGAKIDFDYRQNILPLKNMCVKNLENAVVYSYSTIQDLSNSNLTKILELSNLLDIQTVKIDGDIHMCYLLYDNGVYLYTDIDNYTTSIFISSSSKKATIVPKNNENGFFVVHSSGSDILYNFVSNDLTVGAQMTFFMNVPGVIKDFCKLEIINFGTTIFGVKLENDTMFMCAYDSSKFVQMITKSCANSRIILNNNQILIVILDDYMVCVTKYLKDDSDGEVKFTLDGVPKNIWNASDYLIIGNYELLYNQNLCMVNSYDNA